MDNIKSNIPAICKKKKLSEREFIRQCLLHSVCGVDAAKRILKGSTNIRLITAAGVAKFLGVGLDDLFEL